MPLKLVPPRAGKTPYWSVRGTHLGIYVDRSTKLTVRAKAKRLRDKWAGEIEAGIFARPGEATFLSAAVAYMKAGGETRFMKPLLEHFKERALSSIDQGAIDDAALQLYPDATPATRNRHVYTVVSAILKHAGIDHKLKRPKGAQGETRTAWLWPEQAFRLFKEADKIDGEFGVFLRLLCYTGMRLSEALNLRWDDVRLDEGFAFLPQTKSGDPRAVFLPPHVGMLLQGLLHAPANRVFRFNKNGRLYLLLEQARRNSSLPDSVVVTFHTFRHTWATWMRRYAGLDTQGLVATGAWRDRKSAARYEHAVVSEESMKAALLPVESTDSPGTVVPGSASVAPGYAETSVEKPRKTGAAGQD